LNSKNLCHPQRCEIDDQFFDDSLSAIRFLGNTHSLNHRTQAYKDILSHTLISLSALLTSPIYGQRASAEFE